MIPQTKRERHILTLALALSLCLHIFGILYLHYSAIGLPLSSYPKRALGDDLQAYQPSSSKEDLEKREETLAALFNQFNEQKRNIKNPQNTPTEHFSPSALPIENEKISEFLLNDESAAELLMKRLEIEENFASEIAFSSIAENNLLPFSSPADLRQQLFSDPRKRETPLAGFAPDIGSKEGESLGCHEKIANTSHFTHTVHYIPKSSGKGYFFRINLMPKSGTKFKRIKQNFFFLIDRSNSISHARYLATLKAVSTTIYQISPEDTFNILTFDSEVERFSSSSLLATQDNLQKAQKWLNEQTHQRFLATTDLYSSLGKIIPETVPDHEINTAILLSDGDTFLKTEEQRRVIQQWSSRNHGKVSLFSVASGQNNNLGLLDILSSFNKGILAYAINENTLEQVLSSLIQAIHMPIGKNMSATAINTGMGAISIYPSASRLPDLYEQIPYTIYGSTDYLDDFVLFLQGKYYDSWLDIKKTISFSQAEPGDASIERELRIQCAYDAYERFLQDGHSSHLRKVKNILAPLGIETAFK